jgi:hypothetical protein
MIDFTDIKNGVDSYLNKYGSFPDVPGIQTYPGLFDETEDHWNNNWDLLKLAYLDSCKAAGFPVPSRVFGWAYIDKDKVENTSQKWHRHSDQSDAYVCGVMYLDDYFQGTLFEGYELNPKKHEWNIFSSDLLHSPPPWSGNMGSDRYVIALDGIL